MVIFAVPGDNQNSEYIALNIAMKLGTKIMKQIIEIIAIFLAVIFLNLLEIVFLNAKASAPFQYNINILYIIESGRSSKNFQLLYRCIANAVAISVFCRKRIDVADEYKIVRGV